MNIIKTITSSKDTVRTLTANELALGTQILTTNLSLKPGESIVIVTDKTKLENEAAIWFESAKQITSNIKLIVIDGMTHSGEEPPQEVVNACLAARVVVLHTTYSLTHTQAGKAVQKSGGRGASLPGVNYEMMLRTLNVDYDPIYNLGEILKAKLAKGNTIRITSPAGTNLTAQIRRDRIINDGGFMKSGEKGNLPAGETFFTPLLKTANGIWVVDGAIADSTNKDENITINVTDGVAITIEGGKAADQLIKKLQSIGPEAFSVAEIGIGTNSATNPHGHIIEAEKAYGTAHMALGNSSAIGGEIDVPIHIDGVSLNVTIWIDEEIIMKDGIIIRNEKI